MGTDIWGLMASATLSAARAQAEATTKAGSVARAGDAATKTSGSGMDKDAFMKLLLTQMQNQDPLQPMDGQELFSQLSQLSVLEQMWQMNDSLKSMTQQDSILQASALIGKKVEWTAGDGADKSGVVSGIRLKNSRVILDIGDEQVPLESVTAVHNGEA